MDTYIINVLPQRVSHVESPYEKKHIVAKDVVGLKVGDSVRGLF